jgi:hypothetical protein
MTSADRQSKLASLAQQVRSGTYDNKDSFAAGHAMVEELLQR